MKERPHRRRHEEFAVDDVLRERISNKLAREPSVIVGRSKRSRDRRKSEQKLPKIGVAIDEPRIGWTRNLLAAGPIAGRNPMLLREGDKSLGAQAPCKVAMQMDFW